METEFDITIQIGERTFFAHRKVLTSKVEHFRNMLTADMQESRECHIRLDEQIIDPEVFQWILHYIYTSEITFTSENIQSIYRIADYFCYDELFDKVKRYIKKEMSIDNVLACLSIAIEFNLANLENDCKMFIIANPLNIGGRDLIGQLNYWQFMSLLKNLDDLSQQESMFHYIIEWVLHEEPNLVHLPALLKSLPLESLPYKFIKDVVLKNPIVSQYRELSGTLENFLLNRPKGDTLYTIGAWDSSQGLNSVSRFDSKTEKWTQMSNMPRRQTQFCYCSIADKIYVCGQDFDDRSYNDHLYVFETRNNKWKKLEPVGIPRQSFGMAALDGYIYVAGGNSDVVERYCLQTNQWTEVSPMIQKRTGLQLVEMNGFLYAIGGWNPTDHTLNSVERYNPRDDTWQMMSNMSTRRHNFASAVLQGRIYVLGSSMCEVYSPEDNRWTEMLMPSDDIFATQLFTYNGKLLSNDVLYGQYSNEPVPRRIEVFDFQKQTWVKTSNLQTTGTHLRFVVHKKE